MYSPGPSGYPTPMTLSTLTDDLVAATCTSGSTGTSALWPTSNLAFFYPVPILSQPRTYTKAWWLNGATVAGNVDVGIYTISGTTATRVVASTAEAQAGTSAMQVASTFTTTTLSANTQYYIAMSASINTATYWRSAPTSTILRALGCYQAATSHPLPATATVAIITTGYIPVFGFSENAAV